ncbi:MAG: TonB-dependent receptor plug domain-containing protein [Ignavibacteria bacterium]
MNKLFSIILITFIIYNAAFCQDKEFSTDTLKVESQFFKKESDVNVSFINVPYADLRRAPGATEDVIRFFQSVSGVSIGNDLYNDLIVRGGSPSENLTLIDGVEIPNPNHFGIPGTNSGVLSYISLKLVNDVDFYKGGFPVKFGDRISSIMDIRLREGSRTKHIRDINLSITGFGGFFEGPITKKSSYMFSIRRSYFELIKDQLGDSPIPNYWDFNLKINYELSKKEKLNLIGFYVTDKASNERSSYRSQVADMKIFSGNLSYERILRNGFFNLSVAVNKNKTNALYDTKFENFPRYNIKIKEDELILRLGIKKNISSKTFIDFNADGKIISAVDTIRGSYYTTHTGYIHPGLYSIREFSTYKFSGSVNMNNSLFNDKLIINSGVRYDYFEYINNKSTFSPRIGLSYKLSPKNVINASAGIYHQTPSLIILIGSDKNKNLKSIRADQFVVGFDHLFAHDFLMSVEAFTKQYSDYPASTYDPYSIYINYGTYFGTSFLDEAISAGKGYYRGIDISFVKKLNVSGFYGSLNISLSTSRFTSANGVSQRLTFDNGKQFALIGGYQLKDDWIFGLRVKYAGGRPYTQFDKFNSEILRRGLIDKSRFDLDRQPEYFRVDLRIDKIFKFSKASLVTYIEVQNLLNRKNLYEYYWDNLNNNIQSYNHWAILPVIGLSFQF